MNFGFSIPTKKTAPKPTQSALAAASTEKTDKNAASTHDRHEALRQATERAQIGIRKDDIEEMTKALEEDPTAFDYDDIYEDIQPSLQKKKPVTGNARYGYGITVSDRSSKSEASRVETSQSRYIQSLLTHARERESERELILERQRHKENLKYEEQFGATESFVTPEYQAKMEEDQRKRAELEQREQQDAKSSMGNFYTNLRRATFGGGTMADSEEDTPTAPPPKHVSDHITSTTDESTIPPSSLSPPKTGSPPSSSPSPPDDQAALNVVANKPSRQSLTQMVVVKPRRHTAEMIAQAKERYMLRKQRHING